MKPKNTPVWRLSPSLCLPLKPWSRVRLRHASAVSVTPDLTSVKHVHTDELHNSTMSKSKTDVDPKPTPRWQSVSWQKKDQQFARIPSQWRLSELPSANVTNYLDIPRECGLLTREELDITENFDATALANAIRGRELSCVDVTTAFCKVYIPKDRA